ncbi:hypothetical protein PTKIN_Ptkin12aG0099200 [Pterospermum kingtungense]
MKMYEERENYPHSLDSETSPAMIDDNRMALLKARSNHRGQMVQGSPGNMSATLQQIQSRTPLTTTDIKSEVNLAGNHKVLPMDPSSIYGQAILQLKSGLCGAGLNQGVSGLPLRDSPLTIQNQFLLASQQQHVLAKAQVQGNLGNSTNYAKADLRRFGQLSRNNLNGKDAQFARNDGSICSPVQSSHPKV